MNESIDITIGALIELLESAAQEGMNVADTAGDYTAAGIAYYVYSDFFKGQ